MYAWARGWQQRLAGEADTASLGAYLAGCCRPGQVLALIGEMGAGKTTLVRGLAAGLGVLHPEEVTSPTYALVHEYPTAGPPLLHLDFWRLADAADAVALGLPEVLERADAVVAVEWADRAAALMPPGAWGLRLAGHPEGGRLATAVGPPPRGG